MVPSWRRGVVSAALVAGCVLGVQPIAGRVPVRQFSPPPAVAPSTVSSTAVPSEPTAVPAPVRAAARRVSRGTVRSLPPDQRAQVAVDTALAQIGDPYRWGAAGPSSFDCSGLAMYAWAAAGVALPHSTYAQWRVLPHVALTALLPGDLVFSNRFGHVGIYVGDGRVVHAPHRGTQVRIDQVPRDVVGAARP